jgi:hypothetical protein
MIGLSIPVMQTIGFGFVSVCIFFASVVLTRLTRTELMQGHTYIRYLYLSITAALAILTVWISSWFFLVYMIDAFFLIKQKKVYKMFHPIVCIVSSLLCAGSLLMGGEQIYALVVGLLVILYISISVSYIVIHLHASKKVASTHPSLKDILGEYLFSY